MNSKRKAELQRKLTLNAVPKPPAGLAERIKADIPRYLEPELERGRFSRSIAYTMRVAAAVLLLVTGLAGMLYVLTPAAREESKGAAMAPGPFAPAPRTTMADAVSMTAPEEVRLEIEQEADVPPQIALATPPPPPPVTVSSMREQQSNTAGFAPIPQPVAEPALAAEDFARADAEKGVEGERLTVVAEAPATPAPAATAAAAPAVPAPEPTRVASAPAAPAPVATGRRARAERMSASAPPLPEPSPAPASFSMVPEARAAMAKSALDPQESVFGISVNPGVFERIRTTLESGGRPDPAVVNVEALVNYFAGAPANAPRGVRLEVEASPAAIEADGDHAVLRFTIDTPRSTAAGSVPPIGADARIEVDFNEQVVKVARLAGGDAAIAAQPVLLYNTSVTGIYALELHPKLREAQVLATVRLHYTSVTDGKPQTITRRVLARDLRKTWTQASHRHRLASLGAVWGETLKGTSGGADVARRAEELASQKPDDARARALAKAASASAGGR
jgi:hypothetical protein